MSAIIQELGFDASKAISELRKLDTAMKSVQGRADLMADAFKNLNAVTAATPGAFAQLAQSAGNLQSSVSKVAPAANAAAKALPAVASPAVQQQFAATVQHSQRLTTSLQLLSRIVFTQAVIRGIRLIEQNFVAAGKSAADFQRQLQEIQNLSAAFTPELGTAAIRGVSDRFGFDLQQVGEGLKQIVGDQIGTSPAAQAQFLAESAALAKSGMASLDSAARLLGGTINAFGKDVGEAGRVASVLFSVTDLGSVTVDNLALSMGRVLPLARQLGVSLEEVGASFSVGTRTGTKHNEVATQLSGALTALIKPTEGMKRAFEQLGVSSGEALLAERGLLGGLQAVLRTTDGTGASMAKLFPNVRGLNFALKIGSQNAQAFATDLKQLQGVSSSLSREKAQNILNIDGQRVEREIQTIKNAVTIDFGQSLLKATVGLADFVGGSENIIAAAKAIGPAFLGAAGAIGIFTARSRLGVAEGTRLFGVLGKLATGLALFGAAKSGGEFLGNLASDKLFGDFRKKLEQDAKFIQERADARQDAVAKANASDTDRIRGALASGKPIDTAGLSQLLGVKVEADEVATALAAVTAEAEKMRQAIAASGQSEDQIGRLRAQIRRLDTESAGTAGTIGKLFSGFNVGTVMKQLQEARNEVLRLSSFDEISPKEIDQLDAFVQKLKTFSQATPGTSLGFGTEAAALENAVARLKEIQALQQQSQGGADAQARLQQIQSFLGNLPTAPFDKLQSALGASVGTSAATAANLERGAAAAERAAAAMAGGGGEGEGFARGGLVKPRYFAEGGPVGSDRVPAWLSPGEMVMNRGATSRFFSQLSAMNSGGRPTAATRVGDTTNVTFNGGINVNGGQTNDATGRAIIQTIRRETRRGSSRL